MKKLSFFVTALTLFALGFTSCKPEPEPEPEPDYPCWYG